MGLDNPDLINRTVVRRRAASTTREQEGGRKKGENDDHRYSPPSFRNVRVTNAFKNKMDESRPRLPLHLHFRTVSVVTISRITIGTALRLHPQIGFLSFRRKRTNRRFFIFLNAKSPRNLYLHHTMWLL